jgi:transposase
MLLTQNFIKQFQVKSPVCHNHTTSASFYGECNKNKTEESIKISFGHSKKHRQDLKQLVWSLSVSSDSGLPLLQKAYGGNTADVTTYVEQWHNLIDLLGRKDFLYVADSKLVTKENMAHIHDNEGFFIAPAPMYETYKSAFHHALDHQSQEALLPYLLTAFQYAVRGQILLDDGRIHGFISELTPTQKDIIDILGVPPCYFTYGYLFDTS